MTNAGKIQHLIEQFSFLAKGRLPRPDISLMTSGQGFVNGDVCVWIIDKHMSLFMLDDDMDWYKLGIIIDGTVVGVITYRFGEKKTLELEVYGQGGFDILGPLPSELLELIMKIIVAYDRAFPPKKTAMSIINNYLKG